jgi:hypothetical protein
MHKAIPTAVDATRTIASRMLKLRLIAMSAPAPLCRNLPRQSALAQPASRGRLSTHAARTSGGSTVVSGSVVPEYLRAIRMLSTCSPGHPSAPSTQPKQPNPRANYPLRSQPPVTTVARPWFGRDARPPTSGASPIPLTRARPQTPVSGRPFSLRRPFTRPNRPVLKRCAPASKYLIAREGGESDRFA